MANILLRVHHVCLNLLESVRHAFMSLMLNMQKNLPAHLARRCYTTFGISICRYLCMLLCTMELLIP